MAIELSPTQVQRTDFPVAKKGYDVDAVRAHLRDAAAALENALRRAKLSEDRARRAEESLALASHVQESAAVPERQLAEETERVLRTARESAAAIEEEARRRAEQMMAEAHQQAGALAQDAEARSQQTIRAAEENAQQILSRAQESAGAAVALEEAQARAEQIVAEARERAESIIQAAEEEKIKKFRELQEKTVLLEQRRKEALQELEHRREKALAEIEAKKEELRSLKAELGIKKKKKTKSGRISSGVVEEAKEVAMISGEKRVKARPPSSEEGAAVEEAVASLEGTLDAAISSAETVEARAGLSGAARREEEKGESQYEALFSRFREGEPDVEAAQETAEPSAPAVVAPAGSKPPPPAVARPSGPIPQRISGPVSGPIDVGESVDAEALLATSVEIPVPQSAEIEVPEAQAKIVAVLRKQLVRKLKRSLQDEQNVAVEIIQKSGGAGSADRLVPGAAEMTKRVRNQCDAVLFELAKLGWSSAGGNGPEPTDARSEAIVTARLVDPLRAQLISTVAEGQKAGEAVAALCDRVHNVFRIWRGPEIADLAAFLAHEAFSAGRSASVPQ